MNVQINYPKDNSHIHNLAYIRALLIQATIDKLEIDIKEKVIIKNDILKYLKEN